MNYPLELLHGVDVSILQRGDNLIELLELLLLAWRAHVLPYQ